MYKPENHKEQIQNTGHRHRDTGDTWTHTRWQQHWAEDDYRRTNKERGNDKRLNTNSANEGWSHQEQDSAKENDARQSDWGGKQEGNRTLGTEMSRRWRVSTRGYNFKIKQEMANQTKPKSWGCFVARKQLEDVLTYILKCPVVSWIQMSKHQQIQSSKAWQPAVMSPPGPPMSVPASQSAHIHVMWMWYDTSAEHFYSDDGAVKNKPLLVNNDLLIDWLKYSGVHDYKWHQPDSLIIHSAIQAALSFVTVAVWDIVPR